MDQTTICIVGACKNAEPFLETVLSNLSTISSWFKECRIVIYENDSTDRTHEMLMEWASVEGHNIHRHVIKETNLNARFSDRTVRLAYIRNTLICHVPSNFDYFMMVDLDDVFSRPVDKKSFDSCFEMKDKWDVVTANGYGGYYDIWALRVPGVIEFDCWQKYYELMRSGKYTQQQATYEAVDKFKDYMRDVTEPTYVYGAFNVAMISKVSIVKPCCKYSGIYEGKSSVEHFPFQKCLRSHGARILFNPNFRL
jgi:hypothetical protein